MVRSAITQGNYVSSHINLHMFIAFLLKKYYDTIEDGQNKQSHLLFSNLSFLIST